MYLGTTQDTARGFDYRELPNVIGNFYNAALQARAQTAIQNENIRRIRAGRETVNPSDAVNVTPPMRVQVEPGPDVSARIGSAISTPLLVGGALLALVALSRRRRRS